MVEVRKGAAAPAERPPAVQPGTDVVRNESGRPARVRREAFLNPTLIHHKSGVCAP